MRREMECVKTFHETVVRRSTQVMRRCEIPALRLAGYDLLRLSKTLEEFVGIDDQRLLRAHLMIEELGETLIALATGDEIATLDGLTDLLYVVIGTAVAFDLPLEEAFDEVHASNMTKVKQSDDPAAARVRKKGPNYRAPDVAGILQAYRSKR